jgi:dipeptidyl aminopeptidase/acylaminoacyl peptidase
VPADKIAPVKEITYTARDGLAIPALLTLPRNHQSKPIPFIILPHGGPNRHDTVAFDYMAQFLAALGYGVLQPQYRGSTGHGLALLKAGEGQWGRKMQDDIADGTRWLIQQGYADQARIAIAGFGYGGYAALMGGIRDPDLYACVVAGAPIADLAQFVDDTGHHIGFKTSIPDVKDPDVPLAQISPVKRAREMKSPVLLIHGRLDFMVPVEHSEAMEHELKFHDHPVKAVYFDDADHYFGREADRVAMLQATGEFLAAHLPAGE